MWLEIRRACCVISVRWPRTFGASSKGEWIVGGGVEEYSCIEFEDVYTRTVGYSAASANCLGEVITHASLKDAILLSFFYRVDGDLLK